MSQEQGPAVSPVRRLWSWLSDHTGHRPGANDNRGEPGSPRRESSSFLNVRHAKTAFSLAALMLAAPSVQFATGRPERTREPNTQYSQRVWSLTREFNTKAKDTPILMMDRDWFQLNLALRQIPDHDAQARAELVNDYLQSRLGKRVEAERFYGVVDDLEQGEGYALPAGVGPTEGMGQKKEGFCVVFGQMSDLDARGHVHTLTGLDPEGLHAELAKRPLKKTLTGDEFRRFVDYHEAGHCLYHRQMTSSPRTLGDAVLNRHKSEMYAEIMATLMMARDGVTDFADRAANLRLTGAALNGPAFAHFARPGTFNYFSPAIYMISDGTRGAQKEVERLGVNKLRQMSLDEVRALAHKILDENALDLNEISAVMVMFSNKFDLASLEKTVKNRPELQPSFETARRLRDDMNKALPQVIDLGHFDAKKTPLEQIVYDFEGVKNRPDPAPDTKRAELIIGILSDRMIARAGGKEATTDDLVKTFREEKDFLRRVLDRGTDSERKAAAEYLPLMAAAIKRAVRQVEGGGDPAVKPAGPRLMPRPEAFGPDIRPLLRPSAA